MAEAWGRMSEGKDIRRIFLVDDQPIIHEALRRMLADADDLELHTCSDGGQALSLAGELQPDVILQDLVMPDVDGMMLVKYYRTNALTRDIPVVVLSSRDEACTKADAFAAGASDYLVKLPDRIELLARLRYHAGAHVALLERNAALEELKRISITDGLTGLYNRRYFDQMLEEEWRRARREQQSLSLVLLDIDHFKQFNDHYGHQAGDDCLRRVAAALQSSMHRAADRAARYGGEEFVAIFPNTPLQHAQGMAGHIRRSILDLNIPHAYSSVAEQVTASMGVACTVPNDDRGFKRLVGAADAALYQAKDRGRNCVIAGDCQ